MIKKRKKDNKCLEVKNVKMPNIVLDIINIKTIENRINNRKAIKI